MYFRELGLYYCLMITFLALKYALSEINIAPPAFLIRLALHIFLHPLNVPLWASLVAQTVKNSLVMWETWVRSLGWEDPLQEGMAAHSNILAWRIPKDGGTWRAIVHGVSEILTQQSD